MTMPKVDILPDKTALVQRGLDIVVDKIQQAIADHGYCTLALAGGSTPKPLYGGLAKQDLPWDKLYIFWGDERYVAPDHPDSNAGMTYEVWLDKVALPPEHIFVVPTSEGNPAASAQQYEATLTQVFGQLQGLTPGTVPQFDIILLGMGDDGHTASLFPHTPALQVQDHLVAVGEKQGEPRITFTVPLINQGRNVIFLAAGANKQTALSQVFAAQADDFAFPARLVRPQGNLYWLLDGDAATALKTDSTAQG
jgi:6-phosphogluconolactonase